MEEVLAEIPGVDTRPIASLHIAFNKVDRVDSVSLALAQQKYPEAVFISATERLGLDTLRRRLLQLVDKPIASTV